MISMSESLFDLIIIALVKEFIHVDNKQEIEEIEKRTGKKIS